MAKLIPALSARRARYCTQCDDYVQPVRKCRHMTRAFDSAQTACGCAPYRVVSIDVTPVEAKGDIERCMECGAEWSATEAA